MPNPWSNRPPMASMSNEADDAWGGKLGAERVSWEAPPARWNSFEEMARDNRLRGRHRRELGRRTIGPLRPRGPHRRRSGASTGGSRATRRGTRPSPRRSIAGCRNVSRRMRGARSTSPKTKRSNGSRPPYARPRPSRRRRADVPPAPRSKPCGRARAPSFGPEAKPVSAHWVPERRKSLSSIVSRRPDPSNRGARSAHSSSAPSPIVPWFRSADHRACW